MFLKCLKKFNEVAYEYLCHVVFLSKFENRLRPQSKLDSIMELPICPLGQVQLSLPLISAITMSPERGHDPYTSCVGNNAIASGVKIISLDISLLYEIV